MQKTLWRQTLQLWAYTFIKIPLIAWLRPRVLELSESRSEMVIPLSRRAKNHLNVMYFGALCAGADLAPGLLAMNLIKNRKANCSIIFKDFQADFLKRSEADVHFVCEEGPLINATIDKALQTKERQNVSLNVIATTPSRTGTDPVARFKLTISIKPKS